MVEAHLSLHLDNEKSSDLRHLLPSKKAQILKPSSFTGKVIVCALTWYLFSFTTLFFNKYILSSMNGDPTILSAFQLAMCALGGLFHLKVPLGLQQLLQPINRRQLGNFKVFEFSKIFKSSLIIVGCLRCGTLMFGLLALWYVPVSFAETVKSSAPVFTVVISRLLLGERTTWIVNISLLPVMFGLVLCSAYEVTLAPTGLLASGLAVLCECMQNVYSKRLLSGEKYAPHVLQMYTSIAAFFLQIPCIFLLVNLSEIWESITPAENNLLIAYILGGLSFHCQSMSEYILLSFISPVTHSVANTTKRALLIWLSVIIFHTKVAPLSWLGMALVIFGVFAYNKARQASSHEFSLNEKGLHNV